VSEDDPYTDPATGVLRNKLGIRDPTKLEIHERRLVTQRAREGCPTGDFDLRRLKAIHRHLFQDIYDWAGEIRTVEISKSADHFRFLRYIETGMSDVHRRLVAADFLRGLSSPAFGREAGVIIGDINHVHPFREGNGRSQLQYLKQLAEQAHEIRLDLLSGSRWIAASRAANRGDYGPLSAEIAAAMKTSGRKR
jgi:cell filamentation protein